MPKAIVTDKRSFQGAKTLIQTAMGGIKMEKKFTGLLIGLLVLMSFLIIGFSGKVDAEPIVLKFASVNPPQSSDIQTVSEVFDQMNKEGEGILKIEVYAGGTLGRDPMQLLRLLNTGVADLSHVINSYLPGQFPDDELVNTPFAAQTCTECTSALTKVWAQKLLRGYDDLVVIALYCLDQYSLHTSFPVKVPSDLKGKKIRTAGKMHHAIVQALGAAPVALPVTKVTESISRGVVDGTLSNWVALDSFRISDAATHHLLMPLGTTTVSIVMLKEKYDSLPANARAIIDKYKGEYFSNHYAIKEDKRKKEIIEKLQKNPKHQVYIPNEQEMRQWREQINPVIDVWGKEHANWDNLLKAYTDSLSGKGF